MSIKIQQIQVVYKFILENGFEVTLDEIASGIHVTKKTLHNRYKTKVHLEKQVIEYWRSLLKIRFEEKFEFSNNTVEEILLLIYELEQLKVTEFEFIRIESQNYFSKSINEETFFQHLLTQMIEKGKYNEEIIQDLDISNYVRYFLFNIFHLIIEDSFFKFGTDKNNQISMNSPLAKRSFLVDHIQYLLSPILTVKGKTYLNEINLISFFKVEATRST